MYKANCVDEYGHVYSNKGLLNRYVGDAGPASREFPDLDSAKEFGWSFIDIYPQAVCEIFHNKEIVDSIRDEAYWNWKDSNTEEWRKTYSKVGTLQSVIVGTLLSLLGVLIAFVSHYLAGVPLLYKTVMFPMILMAGAYIFNWAFARLC